MRNFAGLDRDRGKPGAGEMMRSPDPIDGDIEYLVHYARLCKEETSPAARARLIDEYASKIGAIAIACTGNSDAFHRLSTMLARLVDEIAEARIAIDRDRAGRRIGVPGA